MVLLIKQGNKIIGQAKNRKELSTKMSALGIRGFQTKALRKELDNVNTFTKNGYTVTELNKQRALKKVLKNPVVPSHNILPQGRVNRLVGTRARGTLIDLQDDNTLPIIMKEIQDALVNVNKQNKFFQFRMGYKNQGQNVVEGVATSYVSYNDLYNAVRDILNAIINNYGETEIVFKSMMVNYYTVPNLANQVVLGALSSNDKMKKELIERHFKNNRTELMKFLNKYELGCVNTTKNCFAKAVIHSFKKTDDSKVVHNRITDLDRDTGFSNITRELDTQANVIAGFLKCKITVYDDTLKVNCVYGEEYKKEAIVLVYASHTFYLKDREEELNEKVYFQKLKDQKKMETRPQRDYFEEYKYGAYDYETYNDGDKTKPFCVGSYNEIDVKYYESRKMDEDDDVTKTYLEYLLNLKTEKKTKLIMYAHNGGKFDSYELIHKCIKYGINVYNFLCKSGRIIKFCISKSPNLEIEFRDSYTVLQAPLDKLLKDFRCKTKKLTGTVDYKCVDKTNAHTLKIYKLFKKYLHNDVMGLYELVKKIENVFDDCYQIDLYNVLTNASLARKYFIKNHDWEKYELYEIPHHKYLELKDYYYGGRNECFKFNKHQGKFFYYDFTSLYPYMMATKMFPYGKYTTKYPKHQHIFKKKWFGMVNCLVKNTHKENLPLHATKSDNGKLIFAHLDNWTSMWLSTEEVRYSLDNDIGYEYKFIEVLDYEEQKDYYFKDMVDGLYKTKLQAELDDNPALRAIAKVIINSLYGFWGIKLNDIEQVDIKKFENEEKKQNHFLKNLQRGVLVDTYDKEEHTITHTKETLQVECANIIIATMTTSYARTKLYELMNDITDAKGELYYCDTDSVITNICLEDNKKLNKKYKLCIKGDNIKLGDLTNETDERKGFYDELILLGCKSYYLHFPDEDLTGDSLPSKKKSEMKFKGFDIKQKYHSKEYDEETKTIMCEGLDQHGRYTVTPRDYELMTEGYTLETDNFSFITGVKSLQNKDSICYRELTKKATQQYDKGTIDGDNIIPLSI